MPKQVSYHLKEPSGDEPAALRVTRECLNPTASNKKTRILHKENEDILNKLEVGADLAFWFKNTIKVCYDAEAAPFCVSGSGKERLKP